jgi:uncharacterized protein
MTTKSPTPAYDETPKNSAALYGDKALYAKIGAIAEKENEKTLIEEFEIPIRSGKAWVVKKGMSKVGCPKPQYLSKCISDSLTGQLCTLSTPYGPQVGDLNIFSLSNPRERFWASRTKQLHASHVSVGDRLWSCLPYMRPLVTIVGDSLRDYGVDEAGGRVHDLLGTRCDPYGKY